MAYVKQLLSTMTKKQKYGVFLLFVLMVISSFLELLGIALVSPVVTVLQAQNLDVGPFISVVNGNLFSKLTCKIFNIAVIPTNSAKIITAMLILIIALYIFKSCFTIFVAQYSRVFTSSLYRNLSTRLITANLSMPYDYFVNTNSAIIMRKCTNDVSALTDSILGILNMLIASLTSITIFVYLMLKSWQIMLFFTIFMVGAAVLSVFLLKNMSVKVGRKQQTFNAKNISILHKSIYGIKETKIAETDAYFIDEYQKNQYASQKLSIRYSLLSSLPSIIIQNLGIIIVMITTMVLVVLLPRDQSAFIVTLLTSFVLAFLRLLPNILTISNNVVAFSRLKPSLITVFADLEEAERIEQHKMKKNQKYGGKPFLFNDRITIQNLTFSYKKSPVILSDVNLEILKGEYVAFSGNSGAGKTTLIDNLLGLLSPQKGVILCDNQPITRNTKGWHALLSYVPQNIFLLDDTVKANVCFGLNLKKVDDEKVWEALEKAQLKEFVKSLPRQLDTRVGEAGVKLSGGQRQRIGIARAFFRDTPIMVLDEATSALDYQTEENILLNIRKVKGDKTVIIITHRLNTISHCDKIYTIENSICSQIK